MSRQQNKDDCKSTGVNAETLCAIPEDSRGNELPKAIGSGPASGEVEFPDSSGSVAVEKDSPLVVADAAAATRAGQSSWSSPTFDSFTASGKAWMEKLRRGDLSGCVTPPESFIPLRGQQLAANPRVSEEYQKG